MSSGNAMKAGAWIDAKTGNYAWVDGHGRWLDLPAAISTFKLSPETIQDLCKVPWDLSAKPFPEVLAAAMGQGLVRVRLRDTTATFEFRVSIEVAILGAFKFTSENLDPRMLCRFNSLVHGGQSKEFRWERAMKPLSRGDLTFLTPYWLRPPTRPPVPAPWYLYELGDEGQGLGVCALDPELTIPGLLDFIRPHVGPTGGWLGLPDGRRWRLNVDEPPLVRVDQAGMFMGYEVCPDCGWPRLGDIAPCKCWTRTMCRVCTMPTHWPIPMYESIGLDGKMKYVPHVAGYAHRCISWPSVRVVEFPGTSDQGLRGPR